MASAAPDGGWVAAKSRSTGRWYFFNQSTGESRWEQQAQPQAQAQVMDDEQATFAAEHDDREDGDRENCESLIFHSVIKDARQTGRAKMNTSSSNTHTGRGTQMEPR